MRSNLLLHYEEAGGVGVLLTGWTQDGGACQVWEQPSYRQRLNQSEVVSCLPDGSTAGVVFQQAGAWYLAVAATYSTSADTNHLHCEPSKSDKETVITVRSMVNLKSKEELGIIKRREEPLHFVDALQWGDHLFFPYYTLKARLANNTEPPSMAVLRQLGPSDGGLTLQGHVYLDCGCRSLIISSSLVRQGERGWWVGVFRHSHNAKAWNSTAVCIFGMEEMKERACASPHFNMNGKSCTLNIIFEKIPENESGDASQTIQVNVLDCDTIGQAKEKSLQAFFNKNGFLYGLQLDEIGLELVSEEQQRELLDIDGSSEVMDDGIRKLNTIGHYEISNGATIKVFKKKANTRSGNTLTVTHLNFCAEWLGMQRTEL
uniref:Plexin C1 n=1 Tax=Junco hyemalis TaxID=40217 RepID=A0A8C5JBI3_JUNHY